MTIQIQEVVREAFTTGCLTVEAETQLRQLLQMTKYSGEEIRAFVRLQEAVMEGMVVQQSRERTPQFVTKY